MEHPPQSPVELPEPPTQPGSAEIHMPDSTEVKKEKMQTGKESHENRRAIVLKLPARPDEIIPQPSPDTGRILEPPLPPLGPFKRMEESIQADFQTSAKQQRCPRIYFERLRRKRCLSERNDWRRSPVKARATANRYGSCYNIGEGWFGERNRIRTSYWR